MSEEQQIDPFAVEPIAEGETAQPETSSPESGAPSQPVPKKEVDPVEKRIGKLSWQRHEAERTAAAAMSEAQRLRAENAELTRRQQEWERQIRAPRLDQFQSVEAYEQANRAHTQAAIEQADQQARNAFQAQQREAQQRQYNSFVGSRVAEAEQKYDDFREVVLENPQVPQLGNANPALLNAILSHENFADLAYYLGKNPREAHRIAGLHPTTAIMEVGRIAERLAKPAPRQTQAPAPPAQVGSASATADKDPSTMSYDEFVKWRRRSIAQRR